MRGHKGYISRKSESGSKYSYHPVHHKGGEYLFADEVASLIDKGKDYVLNECKSLQKVRINELQVAIPFDDVISYLKRYGKSDRADYLCELHKNYIKRGAYEKR